MEGRQSGWSRRDSAQMTELVLSSLIYIKKRQFQLYTRSILVLDAVERPSSVTL